MPYTVPPRWAHGNQSVNAARMNIYSDDETYLNSLLTGDHQAVQVVTSGTPFFFVHTWRWLHYLSQTGETPTIVDPSGTGDDVALAAAEASMTAYDLAQVSWLTQGQVYQLNNCKAAAEDFES